jgi:hypothetical protein
MTVVKMHHSGVPGDSTATQAPFPIMEKSTKSNLPSLAILLAAGLAQAAHANTPLVIDQFVVPVGGQTITKDGVGTVSSLYTGGGPGLLGGSRLLTLNVTADAGSIANASANGSINNKLVFENGSGVASNLQISYNANGAGLGQNWHNLGEITFIID